MTAAVDAVVIGAGIVGLAIADALSAAGLDTLILDRESRFGTGTSARNSGVIHAGLHYPAGSLKHRSCLRGRELLLDFCKGAGVPYRVCGKLIVAATPESLPELEVLQGKASTNGVPATLLETTDVRRMAPALRCAGAMLSPGTGIVDPYALMQALLGRAEAQGAMLVCRSDVTRIARKGGLWHLRLRGEAEPAVRTRRVVNAAGIAAQAVSRRISGMPGHAIPRQFLARGRYCVYAGKMPFDRLIYPLPEDGGLGIHLTLDMAGQARFGPDVEWIESEDVPLDGFDAAAFADSVRQWWPDCDAGRMTPGYAGIRPKLNGPGEPAADFAIRGPAEHGLPGVIALYGIESPGLTASLALAEIVRDIIR